MATKLHIVILGQGRFGSLWLHCVQGMGRVQAYDPRPEALAQFATQTATEAGPSPVLPDRQALEQALQVCDVLFFCVPISAMQSSLAELQTPLRRRLHSFLQVDSSVKPLWLIDTCSVKVQPMQWLRQAVHGLHCEADLTGRPVKEQAFHILGLHPTFGPDSFELNSSLQDASGHPASAATSAAQPKLRLVLCPDGEPDEHYFLLWQQRFAELGLLPIVMSAEEHDREAARTQGLTHLLGRVLEAFGIGDSPIATTGYRALCQLREQTCHDTWQLFLDLQQQNNYTPLMRQELQKALETVYAALEKREGKTGKD